jgi:hypothetical protein
MAAELLVDDSDRPARPDERICGLPKCLNFVYKLRANEFVFHREDWSHQQD